MASDEEDLARIRQERAKGQFFSWLDEWWDKKQAELNDTKKTRTERKPVRDSQQSSNSFLGGLFG